MRLLLLILFVSGNSATFAQLTIDTSVNLDILKAPASPAFTILGIASSDIERPTDLNSFSISLQQATQNFTAVPKSYAIQVAPFLLSNKKYLLNDFDNKYTFKQSFLFSAGFNYQGPPGKEDVDSLKSSKVGFGIKFSLIRPRWTRETRDRYNALVDAQRNLLNDYRLEEAKNLELPKKREELRKLAGKENKTASEEAKLVVLVNEIQELSASVGDQMNEQLQRSYSSFQVVQQAAIDTKNERKGLFLDFSSAFALHFPDNRFSNSEVYRGGAWLTGGHENGNKGFTSMFILRYLYNPELAFADPNMILENKEFSTLDAGARLLLTAAKGRFAFSGEGLYRSVLWNSAVNSSWRLVINTEYDVAKNRKLTFSFGKDFDGTIRKGGNVISALNLILGFGTERASPTK